MRREWKSVTEHVNFYHSRIQSRIDADAGRWTMKPPSTPQSFQALKYLRHKKVFIASVLRDNAASLPPTLRMIDAVGSFFSQYTVAMYENDSSDATPQILADWARGHPNAARVHVVSERLGAPAAITHGGLSGDRFARLAACRNRYLDLYRAHAPDADFMVVVEDAFDFTADAFLSSFAPEGLARDWSIVGANGVYINHRYVLMHFF
jgi:hypothetical protein